MAMKRRTEEQQADMWIATKNIAHSPGRPFYCAVNRLFAAEGFDRFVEGLLKGKTLGVDATTLEANAALRSIVRRGAGEGYGEFLTQPARASGVETP